MTYNGKVKNGLLCLMMITALLVLPSPGKGEPLAEHRINISFDLAKDKIFGKVDVTFPEHLRAITVGRGLRITKLVIDGKSEKIRVKDGRIALPHYSGSRQIEMEYEGIFSNQEGNNLANTIGEEGVFLISDWFHAAETELAHFSLQALVPANFQAVSEAEDIIIKDMGEQKLITFNFPHPVMNIHFITAPYVVNKDHHGGVLLETYLLPEDKNLASRYLEASKKYVEMYEEMLGPFPFKRFAVVENILPTGYGMPTFTLLGREVLKLPFIPETSLGHEILHSWLGNSVYVDYGKGNWSEGLTTYLADHYYEELRGNGWQYRKGIMEDFESYVHGGNEISIKDFVSGDDRSLRAVGYGKTAMVFNMLHNRVGDKAFREALR
ncbi:MAG: hypothetical protein LJE89_00820, partial [Deltaproteobacteria bacterium]|nr:hypothetical protein [Deltaproteobacteria bacterium]